MKILGISPGFSPPPCAWSGWNARCACTGGGGVPAARQFGFPLEWVGFWEEAVPDMRLVDGVRKSPFLHWRHQHLFRAEGSGTVMTDRVEYALRLGPQGSFLQLFGRLLYVTLMQVVFAVIFLGRHWETAAFFAKTKTAGGDGQ